VAVFAIGMILAGDLRSGKKLESVNVLWTHDVEVPVVQGGDFGHDESLSGVDGSERAAARWLVGRACRMGGRMDCTQLRDRYALSLVDTPVVSHGHGHVWPFC